MTQDDIIQNKWYKIVCQDYKTFFIMDLNSTCAYGCFLLSTNCSNLSFLSKHYGLSVLKKELKKKKIMYKSSF